MPVNYKLQFHSELSQNSASKESPRIASSDKWLAKTTRRCDPVVSGKLKRESCEDDDSNSAISRILLTVRPQGVQYEPNSAALTNSAVCSQLVFTYFL
jgi:hypothetical protein